MRVVAALLGFIVLGAGVVGLGFVASTDIQRAVDEQPSARAAYETLLCLGREVKSLVPPSAVVFVAQPEGERPIYWRQRIWELTSPERFVVNDEESASHVIDLARSSDAPCNGYGVLVAAK